MGITEKAALLYEVVVNECYCLWDIFQENVRAQSDAEFRRKLKDCNTKEEIKNLVNQYI